MPQPPTFLLLLLLSISSALALRLCSFNVRSFGEAKKENKNAMDVIVKTRYLEFREEKYVVPGIMEQVNERTRARLQA